MYDLLHLNRIPRRYTVEADKILSDEWNLVENNSAYDFEIYGPNGYFHKFTGNLNSPEPHISLSYNYKKGIISAKIENKSDIDLEISISSNAYGHRVPPAFNLKPGKSQKMEWLLESSGNWYDFSVKSSGAHLSRFAGRVETGKHSISDPAMAAEI